MLKRINIPLLLGAVFFALMLLAIGFVDKHPAASVLCVILMMPFPRLIRHECGEKRGRRRKEQGGWK